jgi:hypothetical protein
MKHGIIAMRAAPLGLRPSASGHYHHRRLPRARARPQGRGGQASMSGPVLRHRRMVTLPLLH